MIKNYVYPGVVVVILLLAAIQSNSSKPFIRTSFPATDTGLCGVYSDLRYSFFDEGLYEFSLADANTGNAKLSICIEGTEASGRCKEDNFNVPWRCYVG